MKKITLLLCLSGLLAACAPVVYKQDVSVSSQPLGAKILVDGVEEGSTPTSLALARNRDHIVTLLKDGYLQEDVSVKRVYHAEENMLKAVGKGVSDGDFFGDTSMGIQSGIASLESGKATGEAYTLVPGTISLRLTPNGGVAADAKVDFVQVGRSQDISHFRKILERGLVGKAQHWSNRSTGWSFVLTPGDRFRSDGWLQTTFTVVGSCGEQHFSGRYPAYRDGGGVWRIGHPAAASAESQPKVADDAAEGRALLWSAAEVGAASLKPVKAEKRLSSSHHSTIHHDADGGYSEHSSSSSTSASVSVNPLGAVKMLEDLTGESGK